MPTDQSATKRIFYFNVNYACNNQCVFCYSHNTIVASNYAECSVSDINEYLIRMRANSNDRIIINGGEPMLHSQIVEMLLSLIRYKCEVLIYTNGRLLSKLAGIGVPEHYRFVVPIHGCRDVHDSITRCKGSYDDTLQSIEAMMRKENCLIDIKVIINQAMISSETVFNDCIETYRSIPFNGSVHLTKMADTKVSQKNGCKSIPNEVASIYTKRLFELWTNQGRKVKIFDTCIKEISGYYLGTHKHFEKPIEVFFKDCHLIKKIPLFQALEGDCTSCMLKSACYSAVNQYKVLEWNDSVWYENLE